MAKHVIGVNNPAPEQRPARGMQWVRIHGGPNDGQWMQRAKQPKTSTGKE